MLRFWNHEVNSNLDGVEETILRALGVRPPTRSASRPTLPTRGRETWPSAFLACLLLAACAHAPEPVIGELNARLLANPSATAVLEGWCADRHLAPEPKIVARKGPADRPATAEVRAALQAGTDEPVRYRQVQLVCGQVVLSEADNWYRPGQLTEAMNRALETTDAPFGRVVTPLNFTRRRLSVQEGRGAYVLEHRAVLSTAGGAPFSYVVERYTKASVAAPAH